MTSHECSYCRKNFEPDRTAGSQFPFCSRRCRWLDLARWMNEEYSIGRPMTEEEAAYAASREPDDEFPLASDRERTRRPAAFG